MIDTVNFIPSPFRVKLGLALEGMAVWHLALALIAATFLALIILSSRGGPDNDTGDAAAMSGLAAIVVGSGALIVGITFVCASFVLLKRSFRRSDLSLVLGPGLVGTAVTIPASIIGWPTSEAVGAWAAFVLVSRRLDKRSGASPHL